MLAHNRFNVVIFLVDTIKVVILVVAELLQLFATKSLKKKENLRQTGGKIGRNVLS